MRISKNQYGFTLMELVIVIVLLGILSAVAVPRVGGLIDNSRIQSTKNEMQMLRSAIMGDASSAVGGEYADKGYLGDVGAMPPNWDALITKPGSASSWNRNLQSGWNGPYVVNDGGDFKEDVWGNEYTLTDSTIVSAGPDGTANTADDITLTFR